MSQLLERPHPRPCKPDEARSPAEIDSCKVLHSFAFRRLQGKMQIYGNYNSDFHRTRLTHSLEVASIASHIAKFILHSSKPFNALEMNNQESAKEALCSSESPYRIDSTLVHTLGLLHDIGHPPFGHGGETALNCVLTKDPANTIGFEGNAQSFKIAQQLNLTRRTLLGLLKYPVAFSQVNCRPPEEPNGEKAYLNRMIPIQKYEPPKCFYDEDQSMVDWLLSPFGQEAVLFQQHTPGNEEKHGHARYRSLDSSMMDLADDIAYSLHDLEDALFLGLVSLNELNAFTYKGTSLNEYFANIPWQSELLRELPSFIEGIFSERRKMICSHLTHEFVSHVQLKVTNEDFSEPLLRFNVTLPIEFQTFIKSLKSAIGTKVIYSQENQSIVFGGQILVMRLFQALSSNPDLLLSEKDRLAYKEVKSDSMRHRIIANYLAGMTDQYAQQLYQRLYGLNLRSIFEKL